MKLKKLTALTLACAMLATSLPAGGQVLASSGDASGDGITITQQTSTPVIQIQDDGITVAPADEPDHAQETVPATETPDAVPATGTDPGRMDETPQAPASALAAVNPDAGDLPAASVGDTTVYTAGGMAGVTLAAENPTEEALQLRLYLWDWAGELPEDSEAYTDPCEDAAFMGLDETGSLPVSLSASDGTMVSAMASLATETSDDGAVTARYLAFDLPAGTSAQMDLMLSCAAADRIALVPVLVGADDVPQTQPAVSLQWIETPGIATDEIFAVTESGGETPALLGSADGAYVVTGEEGEHYVNLRFVVRDFFTFEGADPEAFEIRADAGDTVTVKAKQAGYVIRNIELYDAESEEEVYTATYPGASYSFTMPDCDVVIKGSCEKANNAGIMLMVGEIGDVITQQSHTPYSYNTAGWFGHDSVKPNVSRWDTSEYRIRFSDGTVRSAFCIEPLRSTPHDGATWTYTGVGAQNGVWVTWRGIDYPEMARALYYGWGSPYDMTWLFATTNEQRVILTHAAAAKGADARGATQYARWQSFLNADGIAAVNKFYDWVIQQPLPDGVIGFTADSGKEQSGSNLGQQLAGLLVLPPPTGTAKLQKIASNMDLVNGNGAFWTDCYTYTGATYGVYNSDWEAYMNINAVGTLTTDWWGNSNELTLSPGTYYVKEISASPGFDLDPNTYPVTVTSGQTATVTSYEPPVSDPMSIGITKIQNGEATSTIPSLEGTQFTINFYAGYYDKNTLPATPTRKWVIEVKEVNGIYMTQLNDTYVVSGLSDPLFRDANGAVTIPLGTITIQETQTAPGYTFDGYLKDQNGNVIATNSDLYVTQIRQNGNTGTLLGGNVFTAEDTPRPTNLQIRKLDPNGNPRSGVTYELKNSKGQVVTTATTDGSGIARFNNLYPDVYTITETNTPDGLQLLKDPITVQAPLRVTEQQIVENGIDRSKCVYDPYENIYYIFDLTYEVNNDVILEMPVTGMTDPLWTWMPLLAGGVLFVGTALAVIRKKRRNA